MSTVLHPSYSAFLSTPCRLPLELVHMILRNLDASTDKPTISACALVHSSWSTFSRHVLFQVIRLNVLTMRQRPHEEYTHINMPDFDAFIAFMRDNPSLCAGVRELEVSGFVSPTWKAMASGEAADNQDVWFRTELDVYDEFDWEWDRTTNQLADAPSSSRWTKLPRSLLYAILSAPRLFPCLEVLALDSLFVEFGPADADSLINSQLPLAKLVLREVGTTGNTDKSVLQFINMFNPVYMAVATFPMKQSDGRVSPELTSILGPKRTTSLEISGAPDASFIMEILRNTPSFLLNLTRLELHVHHASEIVALSNMLKTIGRRLQELSVNLRPACYLAKPEVHMDHDIYVALMRHFTLFPCMGLQSFSLSFSISFDYSGSSNALDCTPHLLATLPPSVLTIALDINFPFVVQAAAINVNWSEVHLALARVGRQLRSAKGKGRIKIIVSNDGAMIEDEERSNVESLFMDNFAMIKDLLQIEFSP